jgi:hypothetical protein
MSLLTLSGYYPNVFPAAVGLLLAAGLKMLLHVTRLAGR